MWKEVLNTDYFFHFTHNNGYEICVTEYIGVWSTFFSKKAFIAQLKNSNEGLELPNDDEYVKKGIHMLSNLDQLKKISIRKEDTHGKTLFISMRIVMGYPFCFEFKLSKGSEEFYFEKITKPLLRTIGDLRASQSELRRLLIKKDNEIEEYKLEGGEIVLRHLKTVAFNDMEHMSKFNTYEEMFGSTNIPASLIEKSLQLQKDVKSEPASGTSSVKEERNNTKQVTNNVKQETNSIKQETNNMKQEPISIRQEPNTPVYEDSQSLLSSVSCKQEIIKVERPTRNNDRRKRPKLNF